jgi:mono/diheme cytochrome c family protein
MSQITFSTSRGAARARATAAVLLMTFATSGTALADPASEGKALLERSCARCHAVVAGAKSPLSKAPNLWTVLRSYPVERLDFELAEGIGSRHSDMPQIQFADEDITRIYYYLHGDDEARPKTP